MKEIFMLSLLVMSFTSLMAGSKKSSSHVKVKKGVIHFFSKKPKNAVIARKQIGKKKLWVMGTRSKGKTRQIRIANKEGKRGVYTAVKFYYPFGKASATWSMKVTREGNIVSVILPWNGTLIGDIMDVNEGKSSSERARKKLGLTEPDSKLPVIYSSGDSISLGYWPYLEAELNNKLNVYYQLELSKDLPSVNLQNNGHAHLAYGVLQKAYENKNFKPDYWLVNFGLHMINTHGNNVPGYGKWVEKFIAYAKKKKVKLIFINTTPYEQSFSPKRNLTVIKFNKEMKTLTRKHKIPVIDMYACMLKTIKKHGAKEVYTDGTHFTDKAKKIQAAYIAKRVKKILKRKK